jgi:hypothetical protein
MQVIFDLRSSEIQRHRKQQTQTPAQVLTWSSHQ